MGQVFAPLKTWSKFILTSVEAFESKYGSSADKNGNSITDLKSGFVSILGQRVKRQEVNKGELMSKKRRDRC